MTSHLTADYNATQRDMLLKLWVYTFWQLTAKRVETGVVKDEFLPITKIDTYENN